MNENFAVGETRYYYLVVDCISTTNGNFQPYIGYGQSPSGIISTGGTSYNNNNNGYENYYFVAAGTPPPVIMSKLTGGITSNANNLVPSQASIVAFGFSVTTNANRTFTQFNINSTSSALNSYIASATLYSCTTNNYSTGTKTAVGTATIGTTYITVNTAGEAINTTTKYYFLVVTMKSSLTPVPETIQFNFTSGQSSPALTQSGGTTFNTINVLGDTYNVNSSVVTVTALTSGLSSGTITAGQTGVVLFGFSVASSKNITISGFNINSTYAADTYFGNAKLYRASTNNYTTATKTLIGTVTLNGNYAQVTGLAETETTTAKYYFLVADNISAVAPTATITFNFISGQTSDAIIQSIPVASTYNTFTISGNTLTLPAPAAVITGLNSSSTNNITTSIVPGNSDIAVFGFKVKAYGSLIIDRFNIPFSTAYQNTFFSNGRLVESADDAYDASDLNSIIGAVNVSATSNANIGDITPMGLTFNDNTRTFFLVVDVNVYNNTGTASTSNYAFTTSQSPAAITYGSPYSTANPGSNVTGATLNFPPGNNTFIWTGNVNTAISNTSNWAGFAAPTLSTNDIVIPGGRPNYPMLTAATTIGDVTFSGTGASLDLNGFAFSPLSITVATNASATFTGTGGVGSLTPTGGITINNGGTLNVSAPITLPNTTSGTLNNTGTLALSGAGALSIPNATATAASTNTGTITQDGTGVLSFAGNFTNAGTINRSSSGTVTFSGTLNNSGTITNSGNGTVSLTKGVTNTATGTITNSGTSGAMNFSSTLANSGTVELAGAAPITITGVITTSSGSNIINSGTGTFTLTANLTNASGATITQSGTGSFVFSGTLTNNGTITFGGGPATITGVFNNASTGSTDLGSSGTKDFNGSSTFTNAGSITMSGGTATIAATTFSNTGTLNASGGTITFDGTTQAINNSNTGTTVSLYNLTLSNSGTKTLDASGTGLFEIKSLGTITLTSNITFAAGSNKLTLRSDTLGTASLAALPTGASVTGTVKVERYLTGNSANSRGWRLLSSPVSTSSSSLITPNLTYVHTNAYTTGSTGTAGGFDATGNPTFYFYRENMAPNNSSFISGNFRGVNKINNTTASTFSFDGGDANASLPAGNGFLFFFRGDRATTTNPTITTTIARPATLTASGYLNQGSITVKPWFTGASTLSYTSATPTTVRGFNLVGNPYASSIDWDAVTKTNISNTIWVYNPTLKVYATYVAGTNGIGTNFNGPSGTADIIPSGQGFFVKATSAAAALTFTESNKVSAQVPAASLLLATAPSTTPTIEYLRIQLYQDSLNKEDALVFFNNNASNNFVQDEDGEYFRGESKVNISTQSADNVALAINQLPHLQGRQVIPLNINISTDGQYQINLTEIKNIPDVYDIYLVDNYKKDSLDLRKYSFYGFAATVSDQNSYGSGRFSLVIQINRANAYKLLDFTAFKTLNTVKLNWKTQNESTTTIFSIERSTDNGATFMVLDVVPSNGSGLYSYIDQSPNLYGPNLYRLKQLDIVAGVSYSVTIPINYLTTASSGDSKLVKIYPNPASSVINLTISSNDPAPAYHITISSLTGTVVKSITTSQTNWQSDVSTLYPGTYFIEVTNDADKKVIGKSRFIKL